MRRVFLIFSGAFLISASSIFAQAQEGTTTDTTRNSDQYKTGDQDRTDQQFPADEQYRNDELGSDRRTNDGLQETDAPITNDDTNAERDVTTPETTYPGNTFPDHNPTVPDNRPGTPDNTDPGTNTNPGSGTQDTGTTGSDGVGTTGTGTTGTPTR